MTEKQLRKHIKPFLEYTIRQIPLNKERGYYFGLCYYASKYAACIYCDNLYDITEIADFIRNRIYSCRKDHAKYQNGYYFWDVYDTESRIKFCEYQLKYVKE